MTFFFHKKKEEKETNYSSLVKFNKIQLNSNGIALTRWNVIYFDSDYFFIALFFLIEINHVVRPKQKQLVVFISEQIEAIFIDSVPALIKNYYFYVKDFANKMYIYSIYFLKPSFQLYSPFLNPLHDK